MISFSGGLNIARFSARNLAHHLVEMRLLTAHTKTVRLSAINFTMNDDYFIFFIPLASNFRVLLLLVALFWSNYEMISKVKFLYCPICIHQRNLFLFCPVHYTLCLLLFLTHTRSPSHQFKIF